MYKYNYLWWLIVCNIVMASILTIPLYKLICNLSDSQYVGICIDQSACGSYLFSTVDCQVVKKDNIVTYVSIISCENMYNNLDMDVYYVSKKQYMADNMLNVMHRKEEHAHIGDIYIKCVSHVSNYALLEFVSLQEDIFVKAGESSLLFFRVYNPTQIEITGISMYFIYPNEVSVYLNKVQCFCFDEIRINAFETIELPVLLFIEMMYSVVYFLDSIYLSYVLFIQT